RYFCFGVFGVVVLTLGGFFCLFFLFIFLKFGANFDHFVPAWVLRRPQELASLAGERDAARELIKVVTF
ncbi:MAG: hypothetical protein ACTHOG_04605, partial [Marmoricola sp.]